MTATASAPLRYSVVMLSYNQAAFIGEAVRALLAQECEPLEIILSDDCSTDETFDIIKTEAKGYGGPHKVFVRQNSHNMGLVAHINQLVELARGDVIVPAYGDDISLPNRLSELAAAFARDTPLLVHSDAVAIDAAGQETETRYRKADFYRTTDPLATATSMSLYLGASGAWHRELFAKYGPLQPSNVFDDHILGFRAALEGRISFIEKPLLKYREGVGLSFQLQDSEANADAASARRRKILSRQIATYRQRIEDARIFGLQDGHPVLKRLQSARREAEMRLSCHDGIGQMLRAHRETPLAALSAAGAEALRMLRRR